jgi:hypothetical protein
MEAAQASDFVGARGHEALTAEFSPVGALEEDIVASSARLIWRKRHLATFKVVEPRPQEKGTSIISLIPSDGPRMSPEEAMKRYQELGKLSDTPQERKHNIISLSDTP